MTNEEKHEKLKKSRETYQQNKTIKDSTQLQKKHTRKEEICKHGANTKGKKWAQERQKYANMQAEQKKARIEQIAANRELKRNTPCKDSIVTESPAYIATEEERVNLYDEDFVVSTHTT
jgi:hypothetical protein